MWRWTGRASRGSRHSSVAPSTRVAPLPWSAARWTRRRTASPRPSWPRAGTATVPRSAAAPTIWGSSVTCAGGMRRRSGPGRSPSPPSTRLVCARAWRSAATTWRSATASRASSTVPSSWPTGPSRKPKRPAIARSRRRRCGGGRRSACSAASWSVRGTSWATLPSCAAGCRIRSARRRICASRRRCSWPRASRRPPSGPCARRSRGRSRTGGRSSWPKRRVTSPSSSAAGGGTPRPKPPRGRRRPSLPAWVRKANSAISPITIGATNSRPSCAGRSYRCTWRKRWPMAGATPSSSPT